jgi:hypothetical protein
VTAAIFGLVGVVIGGLVTGGVQLFLDSRREQREVQRARRLVGAELRDAAYLYAAIAGADEWPEPGGHDEDYVLSTAAWDEHRTHLALALDDELWDQLANNYTILRSDRGAILRSSTRRRVNRFRRRSGRSFNATRNGSVGYRAG